jgi:hypothetical protein
MQAGAPAASWQLRPQKRLRPFFLVFSPKGTRTLLHYKGIISGTHNKFFYSPTLSPRESEKAVQPTVSQRAEAVTRTLGCQESLEQGLTPEFIVVVAALRLSTAVSCITDVALIVGTHTGFFILKK